MALSCRLAARVSSPFLLVDEVLHLVDIAHSCNSSRQCGRQAVPPGAPDFLVIALDALGQVVVQHEADVGFVDPHAEGDGRHDDLDVIPDEQFLVALALLIRQSGMVGADGKALLGQRAQSSSTCLRVETVDDPGLVLESAGETPSVCAQGVVLGDDLDQQVFPVEAGDEFVGVIEAAGWS